MWILLLSGCWLSSGELEAWRSAADGGDLLLPLVHIASGSFEMGCTPGQSSCQSDEEPVHTVSLTRSFWMAETELTQGQYEALMGVNPSDEPHCEACPVQDLSWHDAALAANALSEWESYTACYICSKGLCEAPVDPYDCDGYRLPTEAEWEFAARCGEDLLYAGSNDDDEVAWTNRNAFGESQAVAGKSANACGLYDMSGNVWEWVSDWYDPDYYQTSEAVDPTGFSSGPDKAARGGSYTSASLLSRVSQRSGGDPSDHFSDLGFRLVRSIRSDDVTTW